MKEVLDFLNARVAFLKGFEEGDEEEIIDGEETYTHGLEDGKYREAVFIHKKIKELIKSK